MKADKIQPCPEPGRSRRAEPEGSAVGVYTTEELSCKHVLAPSGRARKPFSTRGLVRQIDFLEPVLTANCMSCNIAKS